MQTLRTRSGRERTGAQRSGRHPGYPPVSHPFFRALEGLQAVRSQEAGDGGPLGSSGPVRAYSVAAFPLCQVSDVPL